jgi:hypothetical protein
VKRACTLCGTQTGQEAILVDYQRQPLWFCSLGCLVTWGEKKMAEEPSSD